MHDLKALMKRHHVPDDFPRVSHQGALPGAQPKLLLRNIAGRYRAGPTDEEVYERYLVCEDFARQLASYTSRKMAENAWSLQEAVSKVEAGILTKVRSGIWDFSDAEIAWTIGHMGQIMSASAIGETPIASESSAPLPAPGAGHDR
ncbi:hypothetical protein A9O66_11520 [Paraburkholderia caribensis]|uniref:Uncharacterized protein n=1 Tax=Paraburkholderia caribensis TaxID=75105 RepID=A0A9Q6WLW2_9BURK|nr:hypothetical protein A9O66_11520 [Paraburkholderia caribensis]